jgi:hypothetical protein
VTRPTMDSLRALAEVSGRAPYLAFEVFVFGGKLLPTGRTLPIVAGTRADAGAQLFAELRGLGERPQGSGLKPTCFWVSEGRYWLLDKSAMFPNALADVDGIYVHWIHLQEIPIGAGSERI